jgi:hypothetical protein
MLERVQGTARNDRGPRRPAARFSLLGVLRIAAAVEVVLAVIFAAAFLIAADPAESDDWIAGGAWIAFFVGYPIVVAVLAHRRPSTPVKLFAIALLAAWPIALSASIKYA